MLKNLIYTGVLLMFSLISEQISAQEKGVRALPSVNVKTLSGESFNTSSFSNDGKPIIVDFWATWCKPCIEELNAIHEEYDEWRKETGVKVIAVSIDDARTMSRVAPFVKGKGWQYENYIDSNGDFKRAMNVNMPPHTFILNSKNEIVWQHVGFTDGNQYDLIEEVRKLIKAESTGSENKQ